MKYTAHVTPLNGVTRRREVEARSRDDAIRAALNGYPRHTRVSVRLDGQPTFVRDALAAFRPAAAAGGAP